MIRTFEKVNLKVFKGIKKNVFWNSCPRASLWIGGGFVFVDFICQLSIESLKEIIGKKYPSLLLYRHDGQLKLNRLNRKGCPAHDSSAFFISLLTTIGILHRSVSTESIKKGINGRKKITYETTTRDTDEDNVVQRLGTMRRPYVHAYVQ